MVAITAPRTAPAPRPRTAPIPRPRHLRSVPTGPAAHPVRPGPEVYRRRRLVAAALVAGVLLAGLWSLGLLDRGPLTAAEQPARLQLIERTTYVVQPGDTLWSIARRAQPTGDIRPLVDRLAAHTGNRPLQVGDRVTVG